MATSGILEASRARVLPLAQGAGRLMSWVQPDRFRQEFELRASGAVCGSLRFETAGSTSASGQAAGGEWRFEQAKLLHPCIFARTASGTEAARAELALFGWAGRARIVLPGGREFLWLPAGVTGLEYVLRDPSGKTLVTFQRPLMKQSSAQDVLRAKVSIDPGFALDPAASVATLLCGYLFRT